jgi:hypothetical protein
VPRPGRHPTRNRSDGPTRPAGWTQRPRRRLGRGSVRRRGAAGDLDPGRRALELLTMNSATMTSSRAMASHSTLSDCAANSWSTWGRCRGGARLMRLLSEVDGAWAGSAIGGQKATRLPAVPTLERSNEPPTTADPPETRTSATGLHRRGPEDRTLRSWVVWAQTASPVRAPIVPMLVGRSGAAGLRLLSGRASQRDVAWHRQLTDLIKRPR